MPTLEITTMIGCPLRCTFCPQDNLRASYGNNEKYLSLDRFKFILAKVPKHVRIDFSGMAEPWANDQATEMLKHALTEGYNVAVYTTLYGMDDPEAVVKLLRDHTPQVETIVVHLPDETGNMRGHKPSEQYDRALAAFIGLRATEIMHIDLMAMGPSSYATVNWLGNDRAANVSRDAIGDQPVESAHHATPVGCSLTPFYDHNVLLPNGDVVLCCMDYSVKHKIGNLMDGDYYDLFASQELAHLHSENMRFGHSDKTLCKSCTRARLYALDDGHNHLWKRAAVQ